MNVAIIAAAGQGKRLAATRPKQFLELAGTPIIFHTLRVFEQCDSIHEIIVVIPSGEAADFLSLAGKYGLRKLSKVVTGGATRAESVLRGLQSVRESLADIVVVHDAVRPFVTCDEINRTIKAAQTEGAAILVRKALDTIKQVANGAIVKTINRDDLRMAVTPQCFRYSVLRNAYENVDVADPELTDESSLVERMGVKVAFVEGSQRNIKITTKEDLVVAEAIIKSP